MKTTEWDRVVSSAPQNAQAAVVRDGSGDQWQADWRNVFAAPPSMRKPPNDPCFTDLTGRRFGRLTVVGLSARKASKDKGSRWVCRCVCANYGIFTIKALKRGKAFACQACEYWEWLRDGRPNAKNPDATALEIIEERKFKLEPAAPRARKEG